ncbi:hypothetical protein AGLY_013620, partial [Aphis glycines]
MTCLCLSRVRCLVVVGMVREGVRQSSVPYRSIVWTVVGRTFCNACLGRVLIANTTQCFYSVLVIVNTYILETLAVAELVAVVTWAGRVAVAVFELSILHIFSTNMINAWVEEMPGRSKPTKLDSGTDARKRLARTPLVGFRLNAFLTAPCEKRASVVTRPERSATSSPACPVGDGRPRWPPACSPPYLAARNLLRWAPPDIGRKPDSNPESALRPTGSWAPIFHIGHSTKSIYILY